MNNVTLSGRFTRSVWSGRCRWLCAGAGSAVGCALEPTISELLTVTRGHAIFHTEIDNRQSTEMIYVTDTGPTSAPSNSRPSVRRIFLITVPHMKLHFAPYPPRDPFPTIIHLGWHGVGKPARSKNCIAAKSSFKLVEFNIEKNKN